MRPALLLALCAAVLPVSGHDADDPAAVVARYYAAIGRGDRAVAFTECDDSRASRKDCADLARMVEGATQLDVRTGDPCDPEGAAGSAYVGIPVDVRVRWRDGRSRRLSGILTLRRTNGPFGCIRCDERWRIYSVRLRPVS